MNLDKNKLKFMYFLPYENTVGADFWIYKGWENGCKKMGIEFKLLLSKHDFYYSVNTYQPDILFIYSKFGFRGKDLKNKTKSLNKLIKKKIKIFLAVDWFPKGHNEATNHEDLNIFKNERYVVFILGKRRRLYEEFNKYTNRDYIKILTALIIIFISQQRS